MYHAESCAFGYNVLYVYVSLVCNLCRTGSAPVHAMRVCSATSVNRRTLHRPTNMFICAEHPVAERCGNRVAVYFDFALGSLIVTSIGVSVSCGKGFYTC